MYVFGYDDLTSCTNANVCARLNALHTALASEAWPEIGDFMFT